MIAVAGVFLTVVDFSPMLAVKSASTAERRGNFHYQGSLSSFTFLSGLAPFRSRHVCLPEFLL